MPSKSYYEIEGVTREELDVIKDDMGLPDNFIESATFGTAEGTPEPESPDMQAFLDAESKAMQQDIGRTALGEHQGDEPGPEAPPTQS